MPPLDTCLKVQVKSWGRASSKAASNSTPQVNIIGFSFRLRREFIMSSRSVTAQRENTEKNSPKSLSELLRSSGESMACIITMAISPRGISSFPMRTARLESPLSRNSRAVSQAPQTSPRARNEWVCIMGMAPAMSPA